jgi:hypothetical protein
VAAARAGHDLAGHPDAVGTNGRPAARLARVIEYDVPDRDGNGTGELIVLLTTITNPLDAHADELAAAYHQRWEQETGHDQLKTHLRGPGKLLRSKLPDLVYQEIWAYLITHHAIVALIAAASDRRRPGPRPHLLHQGPTADPPHRHRDGRHSPLRPGLTPAQATSPRSSSCSSRNAGTGPAPGQSNAPVTTATASRSTATPPAPATTRRPPSTSTGCNRAPHDQLTLRGIGARPDG